MKWLIILLVLHTCISAQENQIYPDSADIQFEIIKVNDTLTITITNNLASLIQDFHFADFTNDTISLVECTVDGVPRTPNVDVEYATVYPDKFTTRWIIDSFTTSLKLKYFPHSSQFSFWSTRPYAFFGMLKTPEVDSVRLLRWIPNQ